MSMVINLVEDHNIYLCEGGPVYNGGVQPTPITYLTQWKIVGNSQVHTDPYLTSWKVSGNSQVHTLPYPDGVVLPNGYKRCEYLESDGVAYIEVPFGFNKTDEVYAKAAMLDIIHNNKYLIAPKQWNTDTNRFGFGVNGTVIEGVTKILFVAAYGTSVDYPRPAIEADTQVHEWSYSNYSYHIDDSSRGFTRTSWGSETANLRLFFGHNAPTECKICEYRHKKANAEYRLIPCLDSNDTPCMYDVINNQAYYNSAGSGSFTYELYPLPTEIWSCGEYNATDGKYHILVKPQGGSIADIALDEPLRKVNDVADTIEFPSETEGKALVTRVLKEVNVTSSASDMIKNSNSDFYRMIFANYPDKKLNNIVFMVEYTTEKNPYINQDKGMACSATSRNMSLYDERFNQVDSKDAFREYLKDAKVIYELDTPTTELVDAPQIAVSPTDTYTSANVVPYSAFEHTENKEIWSCGEYNATDGKYHILVQPQGGSIADIALTEPLRKVNDVADTIVYPHPSGVSNAAMVSIFLMSFPIYKLTADYIIIDRATGLPAGCKTTFSIPSDGKSYSTLKQANILCNKIKDVVSVRDAPNHNGEFIMISTKAICVRNTAIEQTLEAYQSYLDSLGEIEIIYPLKTPHNVDLTVSQIAEAESYSCVISQGGKAVSWSSFETE